MKKILVPTDFSSYARNALFYAIELSKIENASIMLLHAMDEPNGSLTSQTCERKLHSLALDIEHAGRIPFKSICVEGAAEDVICKIIEDEGIDLVVMGTQGQSSFEKIIFGSTTVNIIEKASCPVIAVPVGAPFRPIKKITFATEFRNSDLGEIKEVLDIAKPYRAQIIFLHIAPENESPLLEKEHMEIFKEKVSKEIDYNDVSFQLLHGNNTEIELREYLQSGYADLLIMSAHHRTLWDKIAGYSLTSRMAYNNSVPILVFHYNKEAAVKLFTF
ncbi:MAG: universal stress protein [Bacteroidia bacterium]